MLNNRRFLQNRTRGVHVWITASFLLSTLISNVTLAQVSVYDDSGTLVYLSEPAQRVIALAPYLTELLYAIDAGDKVVGTVAFSDYPPAAKDIPKIGSSNNINYEAIVNLQPDLILAWRSGNGVQVIEKLKQLGFSVYESEPTSLDAISNAMETLGALIGQTAEAKLEATRFKDTLTQLRKQYQKREIKNVLYQIWHDPLQTLNQNHLLNDVITLCGGRNIFADAQALAPIINMEAVLERNPDVIVVSGVGMQEPAWIERWQQWPSLSAVKNDSVFFIPADWLQRHTPRILNGATLMCQQIDEVRKANAGNVDSELN